MSRALTLVAILLALCAGCAGAPATRNADVQELLKLHNEMLDAHLTGDAERFLSSWSNDFLLVNKGTLRKVAPSDLKPGFEAYLGGIDWEYYRDRKAPVVEVSRAGDLAWLAAEVEAKGARRLDDGQTELIEFQSAWVSLFKRVDGDWVLVGNVSNFAE